MDGNMSPIKELGKKLAAMLDEDTWVVIEPLLMEAEVEDEFCQQRIRDFLYAIQLAEPVMKAHAGPTRLREFMETGELQQ